MKSLQKLFLTLMLAGIVSATQAQQQFILQGKVEYEKNKHARLNG